MRKKRGGFKSGSEWRGNRFGAPRKPEIELFRAAKEAVETEKKKSLWIHIMEQAFVDNNILKVVTNKFVPDMTMLKIDPESNRIIVEFKK